jgi:hypothetical protein
MEKNLKNFEQRTKKLNRVFFNFGGTICFLGHSPKLAVLHFAVFN